MHVMVHVSVSYTHLDVYKRQGLEGLITKIDRHKRIAYVNVELLGKLTRVQVGLEIISKS